MREPNLEPRAACGKARILGLIFRALITLFPNFDWEL
jgi:hypothetical protein